MHHSYNYWFCSLPYLCFLKQNLIKSILAVRPSLVCSAIIVTIFQAGNYSCLVAEFHLARLLGFHLVQSYLPTILMVVISWVAFWMDVNAVPGRVTLGITTLLTVSSKATSEFRLFPCMPSTHNQEYRFLSMNVRSTCLALPC